MQDFKVEAKKQETFNKGIFDKLLCKFTIIDIYFEIEKEDEIENRIGQESGIIR